MIALLALAVAAEPVQPDLADPEVRVATQFDVLGSLLDGGMVEPALAMITTMRDQGVTDPRLDVMQARALDAAGMKTEAVATLERLAKTRPGVAEAWALLGVLYSDQQRLVEATAALKRASRLAPKDAAILNNYGFALYASGRTEEAIRAYRKALALDASDPRTRNNLGFALARAGHDREALEAFQGGGTAADARYNLGVACEMRNDRAGAVNAYQAALNLQPQHSLATAALGRLVVTEPK